MKKIYLEASFLMIFFASFRFLFPEKIGLEHFLLGAIGIFTGLTHQELARIRKKLNK